jgi:hypothetical protein
VANVRQQNAGQLLCTPRPVLDVVVAGAVVSAALGLGASVAWIISRVGDAVRTATAAERVLRI